MIVYPLIIFIIILTEFYTFSSKHRCRDSDDSNPTDECSYIKQRNLMKTWLTNKIWNNFWKQLWHGHPDRPRRVGTYESQSSLLRETVNISTDIMAISRAENAGVVDLLVLHGTEIPSDQDRLRSKLTSAAGLPAYEKTPMLLFFQL